jgi:hypothetical protein
LTRGYNVLDLNYGEEAGCNSEIYAYAHRECWQGQLHIRSVSHLIIPTFVASFTCDDSPLEICQTDNTKPIVVDAAGSMLSAMGLDNLRSETNGIECYDVARIFNLTLNAG